MKLNSVLMTYWGIVLLMAGSAFYYVDDDIIGTLSIGAYLIVGTTTIALLFTIGRDKITNYQRDVVYLAYTSMFLHGFTYLRSVIASNHNIVNNEGFASTLTSLAIHLALLGFMYIKAKGGQ